MASSDEEEAFVVERIYAEKVEDGVTKYLVKWQSYPDEECTWEPPESFDNDETLKDWKMLKAKGDLLEGIELARIQQQMDAFQAARSLDEDASGQTSEGQSDLELDEPISPPAKRLKMVHDPPPLSNKSRSSRNPTYTSGRAAEANNRTRLPVPRRADSNEDSNASTTRPEQRSRQDATLRATRPNVSLPRSSVNTESLMTDRKEQATKSKLPAASRPIPPPMKFHAPELTQRKRRSSNANTTNTRREVVGKRFNSLRHQNNARKQQARKHEEPALTPTASLSVEQAKVQTPVAETQPETNDSWLFFSDDETGGSRRAKAEERHRKPGSIASSEQKTTSPHEKQDQVGTIEPQECVHQEQTKLPSAPLQLQIDLQPLIGRDNAGQNSDVVQHDRQQAETQREARVDAVPRSIELSPTTMSTENGIPGVDLPNRVTSGYVQEHIMREGDPADPDISDQVLTESAAPTTTMVRPACRNGLFNQPAPLITPTATLQASPSVAVSDRPAHESARLAEQRPEWQPRVVQPIAQIHPSRENVLRGDVVRAGGREWMRGDLVVEIYLQSQSVGKVKIQGASWAQNSQIVKLKPQNEHNLPINFDRTVTYPDYLAISKVTEWWNVFSVGAVEPFHDSEFQLSSVADYLEGYDVGVCWLHPDPTIDLMLVMYSCRSRSWDGIATHHQTRSGEVRLNIAYRNKFKIPLLDPAPQKTHATRQNTNQSAIEDRDTNMADTPTDFRREPRSRRASVVSNSSSRAYEDIMKSPSEQLTREMAEHALEARSRRASNAADKPVRPSVPLKNVPNDIRQNREDAIMTMTSSPKELDHATTPTDPRPRPVMDPRKESLDHRVMSSPTNNLTKIDAILERSNTSATNSPREADIHPCLDRRLADLSRVSRSNPSIDQRDVRVLLAYKQEDLKKAQEVQEWLRQQVPERSQVKAQVVGLGLADEDEIWKHFKTYVGNKTCVLICDENCPVYRFDGLAKAIFDYDKVLCFQVDLRATDQKPLKTTRMFPTGWAMAIAQDCFLTEPDDVMYILKWLKIRVEHPFSSSMLMLPPNIGGAIQEQAVLCSQPETKSKFLQLLVLIQELIGLSETQTDRLEELGFSIVLPRWEDVYPDTVAVSNAVPAIEQKARDRTMSDEFLKYFGAWALKSLTKHRRFMGFTIKDKPQGNEHVRFFRVPPFVDDDKEKLKAKQKGQDKRRRSRSRDPSVERDKGRGRSQDRGGKERGRAESKNRA